MMIFRTSRGSGSTSCPTSCGSAADAVSGGRVDASLIGKDVKTSAELDEALGGRDPDDVRRGGPALPSERHASGSR